MGLVWGFAGLIVGYLHWGFWYSVYCYCFDLIILWFAVCVLLFSVGYMVLFASCCLGRLRCFAVMLPFAVFILLCVC